MVVGWVNYAGVVHCILCANFRWTENDLAGAEPIWVDTEEAMVPCDHCRYLINQAGEPNGPERKSTRATRAGCSYAR